MNSFQPFNPLHPLTVKEDLIFKPLSYKWKLVVAGTETTSDAINAILLEDVGTQIPIRLTCQELADLQVPLSKLLAKKSVVENRLAELVMKTVKGEESGMSVGAIIFGPLKMFIPQDLVGGNHNKMKLLKAIQRTLKFGKMDIIPLKFLMEGLTVAGWLKTVREAKVKKHVLAKVVKWVWGVAKRLIASQFYVTEGSGSRYKLLYITKKAWQSRTDSAFNKLISSGTLQPLDTEQAEDLVAQRPPAKLRWLPKTIGLRPIVYFKKEKLNLDIIHAKAFLRGLVMKEGYNHLNAKILHEKWKNLVQRNCEEGHEKLYIMTVDIHDAYGSIIQDKILHIVKEASKDALGNDCMNTTVTIDEIGRRMPLVCRELSTKPYRINKQKEKIRKVSELMTTIEVAVKTQMIKRKRKPYLIVKGLSQGMPLSAALCNLYLAHLDRTHLAEFRADHSDTLLRGVDDYLYITPNKSRALRFLEVMSSGFKEYGIHINPTKSQNNLESSSEIKFWGYLINPDNLEVYCEYGAGENAPHRNSVRFSSWANPMAVMEDKLKRFTIYKLNAWTTDVEYMSVQGSMRNVFQTACGAASLLKTMLGVWGNCFDVDAVLGLVRCSIEFVSRRVRRLRFSDGIRLKETSWVITRAYWLGLSFGAADGDNFLGELLPALEIMEEQARCAVRPWVLREMQELTATFPSNFTHYH